MIDRIVTIVLTCDVGAECSASLTPYVGETEEEARTLAVADGWRLGLASHVCGACVYDEADDLSTGAA